MAGDSKELEFDDVVLNTIRVRLREYRVEQNSQIYFPPPAQVEWEELVAEGTEDQPPLPPAFPDDPRTPPDAPPGSTDAPAGPMPVPDIPGVLETPQTVPAGPRDSEPIQPLASTTGTITGIPDPVGNAGEPAVSPEPVGSAGDARSAPDPVGNSGEPAFAPGGPPPEPQPDFADASIPFSPLDPATVDVLSHQTAPVDEPLGVPAEPLEVQTPNVQDFGMLPDVDTDQSPFEGGPPPEDPTQNTDDSPWIDEDEMRRHVVGELVKSASPILMESVTRMVGELEDYFDEQLHELDKRFIV